MTSTITPELQASASVRRTANLFTQFLRNVWLDGRLYLCNRVISYIPSHLIRLAFYQSVMNIKVGKGSTFFMGSYFDCIGGLTIGSHSVVNQNCRLDGRGGLFIGNNVSISAEVMLLTADHDPQSPQFAGRTQPIVIDDYAWIGTRAMILPGITLGKGSVVAAGALVTKDVAPYAIVAGIPAKKIGDRNQDLRYACDYRRLFH